MFVKAVDFLAALCNLLCNKTQKPRQINCVLLFDTGHTQGRNLLFRNFFNVRMSTLIKALIEQMADGD